MIEISKYEALSQYYRAVIRARSGGDLHALDFLDLRGAFIAARMPAIQFLSWCGEMDYSLAAETTDKEAANAEALRMTEQLRAAFGADFSDQPAQKTSSSPRRREDAKNGND